MDDCTYSNPLPQFPGAMRKLVNISLRKNENLPFSVVESVQETDERLADSMSLVGGFRTSSTIEPTILLTVGGILAQDFPHTPLNLGLPVVFPPGQRPVSFCSSVLAPKP
jgi:hypothetical protein